MDGVNVDDADLTTNGGTGGEAIGQRSIVTGRVLDDNGNPVPNTLIEIWQANACGRYVHWRETAFPAPLDPNFLGVGQTRTNADGEYRFLTIKPGAVSVGQPPQCLAAGAHPLLADRARRSRLDSSRRCTSPTTRCSTSIRSFNPSPQHSP